MKCMLSVMLATVVLCGSTIAATAEAGPQGHGKKVGKHQEPRVIVESPQPREVVNYFAPRDVTVIREYYRPFYQPLPPGLEKKYYRTGTLPPGWQKKIHPLPAYIERDLYVLPAGYHRGIIDGRAVVYDPRGVIVDLAVLF